MGRRPAGGASGRASGALVAIAVVAATLFGGTTRAPATLVLAAAGALALIAALVEARRGEPVRLAPAALPLLVLLAVGLAQLAPVPPTVKAALSPAAEEVERLALRGLEPAGRWRPLTADAAATLAQAALAAGLAALALAAARLAGERGRTLLARALLGALAALLLPSLAAALGVPVPRAVLPLAATRAPLPFPLANPNHAAALLAMLLPLALAEAARERAPVASRAGAALLAVAGNVALALTLSRAGIVVGLASEAAMLAWLTRSERRSGRALVAIALVAAGLGVALAAGPMRERLGTTPAAEARLAAWSDGLAMLRDHPLAGVGRGAFPFAFARYDRAAARLRHDFVECEPLQAALDLGLPGALALAAALGLAVAQAARARGTATPRTVAARIGLVALAAHSLVDFSVEMGGIAAAGCALAALAFSPSGKRVARATGGLLAAVALALAALGISGRVPSADEDAARLRAADASHAPADAIARLEEAAFRRHPADSLLADLAARRRLACGDPRALDWLDRALLVGPRDLAAHRLTARALVAAGQLAQAAGELRFALEEAGDRDRGEIVVEAVELLGRVGDGAALADAVPPRATVRHEVLAQLAARGLPAAIERVGAAVLADDPDDTTALRQVVAAALATERAPEDVLALRARAERLASLDRSPETAILAARALERAGDRAAADRVLAAALARAPSTEASLERYRLALAGGDLAAASSVLEDAIARAADPRAKAGLHRARAALDERRGLTAQAAWERAEADRLAPP